MTLSRSDRRVFRLSGLAWQSTQSVYRPGSWDWGRIPTRLLGGVPMGRMVGLWRLWCGMGRSVAEHTVLFLELRTHPMVSQVSPLQKLNIAIA
jgi:hypothetical protein